MTTLTLPIPTRRLILRSFRIEDLDAFQAYRSEPEVARYQSWSAPFARSEAKAFVRAIAGQSPGTPGRWCQIAIETAGEGRLIGDCAVLVLADDPRQAEIGFTLSGREQGKGYAVEAVANLLDRLYGELELHRVRAICDTENGRSVRLLERLGFRREAHFLQNVWFKGAWGSEYLYALLASEWRERRELWSASGWL